MTFRFIALAALGGLAACATPAPQAFNGNSAQFNPAPINTIPAPVEVPPPAPVSTTSLDNGPVIPLQSTNGMPPPPVEVGVVGPIGDADADRIDITSAGIGTGEFQ